MAEKGWTYVKWKKKKDGTYVAVRRSPYRQLIPPICVLTLLLAVIIIVTFI